MHFTENLIEFALVTNAVDSLLFRRRSLINKRAWRENLNIVHKLQFVLN